MVSVEYKPQLLEDGIAAYMQNHPEKTLGTLAKEAGISEGHLSRMWHGKIVPPRVKIVTLKRIALALGQDPARYYTEPNPASEPADIGQVVAGVFAYDMPNRQTYFGKPDNGTLRDACHVSTRGLSQSPFSPVEALESPHEQHPGPPSGRSRYRRPDCPRRLLAHQTHCLRFCYEQR